MIRQSDSDFIVSVLDLFEGQLSLNDILNIDIAFLKELFASRQKLIEEKNEARNKALEDAANQSNDYY